MRAALLLSSWDDSNSADRQIVADLVGTIYPEARELLLELTYGEDPLLGRTNDCWHIVSTVDAWLELGRYFLADDLTVFAAQAEDILRECDPKLRLPPDQQWRAPIDGVRFRHSTSLRNGIATTLAAISTFGENVVTGTHRHGEDWARGIVRSVFNAANLDGSCEFWSSLHLLLPLLAEAAPQEFLDAVAVGLKGPKPVLAAIFQDDKSRSLFGAHSPHTGFLWAIETVAWSTQYLADAVDVLAALDRVDPGGTFSNRPFASMEKILRPAIQGTSADFPTCLAVVDRLRKRAGHGVAGHGFDAAKPSGLDASDPCDGISRVEARASSRPSC